MTTTHPSDAPFLQKIPTPSCLATGSDSSLLDEPAEFGCVGKILQRYMMKMISSVGVTVPAAAMLNEDKRLIGKLYLRPDWESWVCFWLFCGHGFLGPNLQGGASWE